MYIFGGVIIIFYKIFDFSANIMELKMSALITCIK